MTLQKVLRFVKNSKILQKSIAYKSVQISQKSRKYHTVPVKLFIGSPFTIMGIWGLVKSKTEEEIVDVAKDVLLAKADALFDQGKYKELYDLLSKDSRDIEILWRLARALYNMAKTANEVEAKKMIFEAYDIIWTALSISNDHWAVHKWMSILLDSKSTYEGMKARIKELYNIKMHMMRAIELNPEDATTLYMLGNWCYQISDLAWYQRKIAAVAFGEPPTSSFEEALTYFDNAEKLDPNFYSHNLLMLGKTLLKLNRQKEALEYLTKAAEYSASNDDDHKAKQEAQKLLTSLQ